MENLRTFNQALWILGSVATVVLALRLYSSGLARIYRAFFAFLCFTLARDFFLRLVQLTRDDYAYFYMVTQAVVALLFGCVIAELFSLILRHYPAIRSASRWGLCIIALLCTAIGCMLFYTELSATARINQWKLPLFFAGERSVYIAYTGCILLGSMFLAWYPIRLPRNVIVHFLIFTGYFLAKAAATLVRALLARPQFAQLDLAFLAFSCLAVCLWALLLKPSGEHVDVVVGHQWNRAEAQKLLNQLEGINTALARAGQQ